MFLPDSSLFLTPCAPPEWSCFFSALLYWFLSHSPTVVSGGWTQPTVHGNISPPDHIGFPDTALRKTCAFLFLLVTPAAPPLALLDFPVFLLYIYLFLLFLLLFLLMKFHHFNFFFIKTILTYLLLRSLHNGSKTGSAASLDAREKKSDPAWLLENKKKEEKSKIKHGDSQ